MTRRWLWLAFPLLVASPTALGKGPPKLPPAPKIVGLTAPDPHPKACVDCHKLLPQMDVRISTLMNRWITGVEPKLLESARAAAPHVKLEGKHPRVAVAGRDVPKSCLTCHRKGSKRAPEFSRLMHRIHLVGGDKNHFMTLYQGGCTHCHKLDVVNGAWRIPGGVEK